MLVAVGDTASQGKSNLAAVEERAVAHPVARRVAAVASAAKEKERASRVGSCCSPSQQERSASRKELSVCAQFSASRGAKLCRDLERLVQAARYVMSALSLGRWVVEARRGEVRAAAAVGHVQNQRPRRTGHVRYAPCRSVDGARGSITIQAESALALTLAARVAIVNKTINSLPPARAHARLTPQNHLVLPATRFTLYGALLLHHCA